MKQSFQFKDCDVIIIVHKLLKIWNKEVFLKIQCNQQNINYNIQFIKLRYIPYIYVINQQYRRVISEESKMSTMQLNQYQKNTIFRHQLQDRNSKEQRKQLQPSNSRIKSNKLYKHIENYDREQTDNSRVSCVGKIKRNQSQTNIPLSVDSRIIHHLNIRNQSLEGSRIDGQNISVSRIVKNRRINSLNQIPKDYNSIRPNYSYANTSENNRIYHNQNSVPTENNKSSVHKDIYSLFENNKFLSSRFQKHQKSTNMLPKKSGNFGKFQSFNKQIGLAKISSKNLRFSDDKQFPQQKFQSQNIRDISSFKNQLKQNSEYINTLKTIEEQNKIIMDNIARVKNKMKNMESHKILYFDNCSQEKFEVKPKQNKTTVQEQISLKPICMELQVSRKKLPLKQKQNINNVDIKTTKYLQREALQQYSHNINSKKIITEKRTNSQNESQREQKIKGLELKLKRQEKEIMKHIIQRNFWQNKYQKLNNQRQIQSSNVFRCQISGYRNQYSDSLLPPSDQLIENEQRQQTKFISIDKSQRNLKQPFQEDNKVFNQKMDYGNSQQSIIEAQWKSDTQVSIF